MPSDRTLIGEHEGHKIILDGHWLIVYQVDEDLTLDYMGRIAVLDF